MGYEVWLADLCSGAGKCWLVLDACDAPEFLLLIRSGSTMVGESRSAGRCWAMNISSPACRCQPALLMVGGLPTSQVGQEP